MTLSWWSSANNSCMHFYACRSWGFLHAIQPFRPWRCKALPIVDLDTLLLCASDSFTSFFVVVLGFSLTVRAKVCSALGDDVLLLPERFSVCVAPSFLYLGTIYFKDTCGTFSCLEIAPKKKPDLWRVTILFLRGLAKLLRFSHDIKCNKALAKYKPGAFTISF